MIGIRNLDLAIFRQKEISTACRIATRLTTLADAVLLQIGSGELTSEFRRGLLAYIADYFRWKTEKSAEENIRKLQDEEMPRIKACAELIGAKHTIRKTSSSTYKEKSDQPVSQIIMQGVTAQLSRSAQL